MKAKIEMIALQEAPTSHQSHFNSQPHTGILSEKSAIILCGMSVAVFTLPILVVIHVLSGLYWGGVSVYQLLNGSELGKIDDL